MSHFSNLWIVRMMTGEQLDSVSMFSVWKVDKCGSKRNDHSQACEKLKDFPSIQGGSVPKLLSAHNIPQNYYLSITERHLNTFLSSIMPVLTEENKQEKFLFANVTTILKTCR